MSDEPVLVTGGPGYIGSHVVANALKAGCRVRTTVRSLEKEVALRAMVLKAGADAGDNLSVVVADLQNDEDRPKAVDGCDHTCCMWHHQHFKHFRRRRKK